MMTKTWLYDGIIYIYALSLLFYLSDFIGKSQKAKRMGTGLLIVVWVLQTVFFVHRMVMLDSVPLITLFETLFFFSWILVSFSLVMHYIFSFDLLVFFVNIAAFTLLVLNLFSDNSASSDTGWVIEQEILFIHIVLAILSYAAFFFAALFSVLYIFLHRQLKAKRWSTMMKRLPSLDKMENFIFRAVLVGMPLLIGSVVLGIVWIASTSEFEMLFDPKVYNSFLILAAYAFYIVKRISLHSSGIRLAVWNLAAFGVIVINFMITNYFSDFHQWIWM